MGKRKKGVPQLEVKVRYKATPEAKVRLHRIYDLLLERSFLCKEGKDEIQK
jgi:hypothetical protein